MKKEKVGKKTVIFLVVGAAVLAAAVGGLLFWWRSGSGKQDTFPLGSPQNGGGFAVTGDMVAASGVTSVGVIEESFAVENLTNTLEIEEMYVYSEDVVSQGDRVLKFTRESVDEVREELEQDLKEADLAYRAGAIAYEQNLIAAEYDRDSAVLGGEQAQEIYEETAAGLQDAVDRAQEALDEAREEIAEYQAYGDEDSYREYFQVDAYQKIYDENLAELTEKMEEWGISWAQVTGGGGVRGTFTGNVSQQQLLASLYTILEDNLAELEEAEREYEEAQLSAALNLQTLELRLPGLEKELAQAKQNYETQLLQAKLTLEESLAKAESAESNYETAVKQAESDYETLKDAWEDAKENLELFERTAGDGYFYASGSGTVLRTMVRAGQELMAESIIFMYSDPAAMTVTVSVDQADIAGIALGDRVYIQSSESGGFEGLVTEIDPVSSSTSRTSVTYRVTVEFTEDASVLGANESVTVIFGGDVDALKAMQNPAEGAQMPEGGQMPEEGQIPAGSRMSGGSQEPEGNRMPEGSQKPEGSRMSEGSQVPEGGQMPE